MSSDQFDIERLKKQAQEHYDLTMAQIPSWAKVQAPNGKYYLNTPAFPRGRLSDFFSAPRPMKETGMYLSFWNGSYYSGMRVNTTEKFSKYTSENMLSLDKHIKVVRPTGCNYVRVYVQYDQIIGSRCLLKVSLRTFNKWKDSGNA